METGDEVEQPAALLTQEEKKAAVARNVIRRYARWSTPALPVPYKTALEERASSMGAWYGITRPKDQITRHDVTSSGEVADDACRTSPWQGE